MSKSTHARKFRKKPVVVEAFHLSPELTPEGNDALHLFLASVHWESDRDGGLLIHTLEGTMRGDSGDWIIKGVKGEFYPCKPDIFEATYEPAD